MFEKVMPLYMKYVFEFEITQATLCRIQYLLLLNMDFGMFDKILCFALDFTNDAGCASITP